MNEGHCGGWQLCVCGEGQSGAEMRAEQKRDVVHHVESRGEGKERRRRGEERERSGEEKEKEQQQQQQQQHEERAG